MYVYVWYSCRCRPYISVMSPKPRLAKIQGQNQRSLTNHSKQNLLISTHMSTYIHAEILTIRGSPVLVKMFLTDLTFHIKSQILTEQSMCYINMCCVIITFPVWKWRWLRKERIKRHFWINFKKKTTFIININKYWIK